MQANVKPGTRCECRGDGSQHMHHYDKATKRTTVNCQAEAVRMVTFYRIVATSKPYGFAQGIGPMCDTKRETKQVPMCETCAAWHESRQKERV